MTIGSAAISWDTYALAQTVLAIVNRRAPSSISTQ